MNYVFHPRVTMRSPLSVDECGARVADIVEGRRLMILRNFSASVSIVGYIRRNTFRLRRRIFYGEPTRSRRFFYGRLIPCDGGTLIEGKFRMGSFARAWFGLYMSGCALCLMVTLLLGDLTRGDTLTAVGVMLGMMVLGETGLLFGRWLGSPCDREIVGFLLKELDAVIVESK